MTTELLFRSDAYLKSAQAQVIAVHERGIELDRTIFYPMGGGQAGDTGALLRASGEAIAIVDTRPPIYASFYYSRSHRELFAGL